MQPAGAAEVSSSRSGPRHPSGMGAHVHDVSLLVESVTSVGSSKPRTVEHAGAPRTSARIVTAARLFVSFGRFCTIG